MTTDPLAASPPTVQPLLHDAVIALRAPTQVWSGRGGDLGAAAIDGIYHGDVRYVRALEATCDGSALEWISVSADGPARTVFVGLVRGLDDRTPDPKVRIRRERTVRPGRIDETWTLESARADPVATRLSLALEHEFALMHEIKSGAPRRRETEFTQTDDAVVATSGDQCAVTRAADATIGLRGHDVVVQWSLNVPAHGRTTVEWSIELHDDTLVVGAAPGDGAWDATAEADAARRLEPRLAHWLSTALPDLDALRLVLPAHPDDPFFAAGAPWFFTLFGRDSIWAARLVLGLDPKIAASTLRVLAALQGRVDDPGSAQQPGKILHELRGTVLELPEEGLALPPVYYGSVDSTPLWVCLLADAWRAGMPRDEVVRLLPALVAALRWIVEFGDSDGDGFLDYIDRTGTGLANQGWKDSGDSVQWRDGTLATGPIALCEVQGYAYEAACAGADILEAFGVETSDDLSPAVLRAWAQRLRDRFAASFWVTTPEGRYPAIALDRDKRRVDTLTSNVGHLIGTGILDPSDEEHLAGLLREPSMSSGFGIRTMSTQAAGYWPLSYHGGSVWTHDTAIIARGLLRAGFPDAARDVARGMLDAAEAFDYRVPELHSGDSVGVAPRPAPYPAACRPQAWSAAAAVTCAEILLSA